MTSPFEGYVAFDNPPRYFEIYQAQNKWWYWKDRMGLGKEAGPFVSAKEAWEAAKYWKPRMERLFYDRGKNYERHDPPKVDSKWVCSCGSVYRTQRDLIRHAVNCESHNK